MILALFIYLVAHVGVVTAPPSIVNTMATGSVVTELNGYYQGQKNK